MQREAAGLTAGPNSGILKNIEKLECYKAYFLYVRQSQSFSQRIGHGSFLFYVGEQNTPYNNIFLDTASLSA